MQKGGAPYKECRLFLCLTSCMVIWMCYFPWEPVVEGKNLTVSTMLYSPDDFQKRYGAVWLLFP